MDITEALKKVKHRSTLNIPTAPPPQKQSENHALMRPYSVHKQDKKKLPATENSKNKTQNQKGTLREQQGNIKGTTREQQGNNKGTTREQQGNNKGTTREQKQAPHTVELGNKKLSRISEQQTKIMLFVFNKIISNDGYSTGPIIYKELCEECKTSYETVKMQIKRLIYKELLSRMPGKKGRGGYMIFKINEYIYSELLFLREQKPNAILTKKGTTFPLSSSSIYNNTTTYKNINLGNIQKALNALTTKGQFFNNSSLKSIYAHAGDQLTSEQIQNSLDEFAYGLENHGNEEPYASMDNPGAILFKTLKNGDCWEEDRYLTPEELTIKNYYDNICAAFSKSEQQHFTSWLINNRDDIFKKCQAKLPSTYYLSESEFMEKAKKEFKENILSELKIGHAIEILGEDKKELLQKIERLKSS